jgi:hypothetical protein
MIYRVLGKSKAKRFYCQRIFIFVSKFFYDEINIDWIALDEFYGALCTEAYDGNSRCGSGEDCACDECGGEVFGLYGLHGLHAHEGGYGEGIGQNLFYLLPKGWGRCGETSSDFYV